MRYWRDREVSDRLRNDRIDRKAAREPEQLSSAIGLEWTERGDDDG